jgi:uncharacterized lipoprotein YmbA
MTRKSLIVLTVVIAGCGFLSRGPKNEFYSLDTLPAEGARAAVTGAPIGIDGVELPPGLDRKDVAVRGMDHRLEVRGAHQWASPLEEMVIHTLAFDLANRLPDGMVILPGQMKPAGAMRSLSVVFEDLAAGPDRVFVLDARWTLNGVTRHERITVNAESLESAAIADAMSRTLATLADRIVAGM